jgi:hypothetical protein
MVQTEYTSLKSASDQIPLIPQRAASYHILNYPLIPCLMWVWETRFPQVRNADVHLVAKFGDGLEVKFVRTPDTANLTSTHLLFVVSGVHHVHSLPNAKLHINVIQLWVNVTLTPYWRV